MAALTSMFVILNKLYVRADGQNRIPLNYPWDEGKGKAQRIIRKVSVPYQLLLVKRAEKTGCEDKKRNIEGVKIYIQCYEVQGNCGLCTLSIQP